MASSYTGEGLVGTTFPRELAHALNTLLAQLRINEHAGYRFRQARFIVRVGQ